MTFTEKLKEVLEKNRKYERFNPEVLSMYIHLLDILILKKPDGLDWIYESIQEDPEQEDWFYSFHKGFRQWDTFDIYIKTPKPKLTEEEKQRYEELTKYLKENKHDDWLKDDDYRAKLTERRPLMDKMLDDGYRSIGGQLDMLFWNLIHIDKKGILLRTMEGLFEDLADGMEKL